jgi:hypothetical protein
MDNTNEHLACSRALQQIAKDFPASDVFRPRLLAEENGKFLVTVVFGSSDLDIKPWPIVLYAVSDDLETAVIVDDKEGLRYGYQPERRL